MTSTVLVRALAGASLLASCCAAQAQSMPAAQADGADEPEEIIVTARRKDESLQDAPLTINAVTSEELGKLNIRGFEDISTVVPGLSLSTSANGTGGVASVRGIAFDANASGNNPSVEFYLNDAPVTSGLLFQAMFDLGQVEVLRGPQGTLRGRASPSGSVTVTSKRPDLDRVGGYVNMTGTSIGGINANGAIGVPIVAGVLAVRIAGVIDENEGARVTSINNRSDSSSRTRGGRGTVRFDPTDTLTLVGTYQRLVRNQHSFDQVESLSLFSPGAAASPVPIVGSDRLAVEDKGREFRQAYDAYNLQASWKVAGQQLNYVGSFTKQDIRAFTPVDPGNFFGAAYPIAIQTAGNSLSTVTKQQSHELRLSSQERVLGAFDYILGGFYNKNKNPTDLVQQTPFFSGTVVSPTTPSSVLSTPVARRGETTEKSLFGNLTWHLGDTTEVSGGLRYIDYKQTGSLATNGVINPRANQDDHYTTFIYSGVINHRFTDDLMAYASVGSSWRPGISAVGDFSLNISVLENSFINLPPEKSTSYELGLKSSWFDKRLRFNVSAFHQDFTNYPLRPSGAGLYYVSTDFNARTNSNIETVKLFNFVGAVPVKVDGAELEANFQASRQWSMGLTASYARSKVKNGLVPCNDYAPRDGVPDATSSVPTVAGIRGATGGDNLSACRVNYSASLAPKFSAVVQSEYLVPLASTFDGYVRGLLSYYGKSQVDPSNAVDDTKAYTLLNVYLGLRDVKSAWEVSVYAKNLLDTKRALSRSSTPLTASYASLLGGQTGASSYRLISYTQPREFGLNIRYAFGAR